LVTPAGVVAQTTTADGTGTFRFGGVTPGQYELHARFEGFKPIVVRVRVTARSPAAQKLVLPIAGLAQEITVSNSTQIDPAGAANADAVAVDQTMLDSLPIFDQDYVASLSRF